MHMLLINIKEIFLPLGSTYDFWGILRELFYHFFFQETRHNALDSKFQNLITMNCQEKANISHSIHHFTSAYYSFQISGYTCTFIWVSLLCILPLYCRFPLVFIEPYFFSFKSNASPITSWVILSKVKMPIIPFNLTIIHWNVDCNQN